MILKTEGDSVFTVRLTDVVHLHINAVNKICITKTKPQLDAKLTLFNFAVRHVMFFLFLLLFSSII